jgi:hypothetical protein
MYKEYNYSDNENTSHKDNCPSDSSGHNIDKAKLLSSGRLTYGYLMAM